MTRNEAADKLRDGLAWRRAELLDEALATERRLGEALLIADFTKRLDRLQDEVLTAIGNARSDRAAIQRAAAPALNELDRMLSEHEPFWDEFAGKQTCTCEQWTDEAGEPWVAHARASFAGDRAP